MFVVYMHQAKQEGVDLSDYQNMPVAVEFSVAGESAAKRVSNFAKRFRARPTILLTSL